jgi:phenylalanyl-tRNA synthetase beta subunit
LVNGTRLGWLGEMTEDVRRQLDLDDPVTACEIDLTVLEGIADFFPAYQPIPEFQGSERDLNFMLDETVTWQELEEIVKARCYDPWSLSVNSAGSRFRPTKSPTTCGSSTGRAIAP